MDFIPVPARFTVESLNEALTLAESQPHATLRIPVTLGFKSVISSSSFLQLVLSWAKHSVRKSVNFTIRSETDIDFLYRSAETLLPLLVAREATATILSSGNTRQLDIKSFQLKGLEIFAQLQGGRPVQQMLFDAEEVATATIPRKGDRIHLLAADAFGDYSYPNWFYGGSPEKRQIRGMDDFISLVRSVAAVMGVGSPRSFSKWIENLSLPFGEMLYELFDNTHNWGRYGLNQQLIPLVRGVVFDIRYDYPGNLTRISDIASEIPMIRNFINHHQSSGKFPNLGLMEVTVFDGGVGLPTRELKLMGIEKPSRADEIKAAIACFKKWVTSSRTSGRGLGLSKVINIASEKEGFIYLRTGTLTLFRDFANKPGGAYHIDDEIFESVDSANAVNATGTFFTIILPFSA